MKTFFTVTFAFCALVLFALHCTEFDFNSPLDPKSPSYIGLDNPPDVPDNRVTFYCPNDCEAIQGTSIPGICFDTRERCEDSIEQGCTAGVDCDTDVGYCDDDCELVARYTCTGSFSQTEPAICQYVTYYCPDECNEQQGATRPSGCYATQASCEANMTVSGLFCFWGASLYNNYTCYCGLVNGVFATYANCTNYEGTIVESCTDICTNCTPWQGNGCPDDEGYCGLGCTLVARADCASGAFNQTQPSSCNTQGGGEGTFTDSRDGQTYRYVTIGSQTWMAENLSFNADGSWCNGNDANNCNGYGRHYDWATAMQISTTYNSSLWNGSDVNHRGVCPSGWHLPSDAEWTTLVNFVGSNAGTKLKSSTGWEPWSGVPFGTDDYGFSALPGGYRGDGSFNLVGDWGFWWSASENGAGHARIWYMGYSDEGVYSNWNGKSSGQSVRCVRRD